MSRKQVHSLSQYHAPSAGALRVEAHPERRLVGGWWGIVPYFHFREPYNRITLETRAHYSIGGHARLIQRLRVGRLFGISSAGRASWFIGWIKWTEVRFDDSE